MTKVRAFLLHLVASAAAFAVLVGVFVKLWYPMPYFVADGGWQGLRLVAGVDLVLGPLLTLVIYNGAKSRAALTFDYTVIGALQALALGLGIFVSYTQRTVLVVFADGAFYSANADAAAQIGEAARAVIKASSTTPALALVRLPDDARARQRLRAEALSTGRPLYARGDLLEPFGSSAFGPVRERASDVAAFVREKPEERRKLETFVAKSGKRPEAFVFVPLQCRYATLALAFDRATGEPEGWLSIPLRQEGHFQHTSTSAVGGPEQRAPVR